VRLEPIILPNYESPLPLLRREIAHCNVLYILSTDQEEVASCFLVSEGYISVEGIAKAAVYLGLSATSAATKNTALVRELYKRCAEDIRQREQSDDEMRVIWFTTATPSAYYGGSLYWEVEPLPDGSYSVGSKLLGDAICTQMEFERREGDHPFALRGAAGLVRYSQAERDRINKIVAKSGFSLLEMLKIDETCGDRLLATARSKSSLKPQTAQAG
jgi:hypothetical protein